MLLAFIGFYFAITHRPEVEEHRTTASSQGAIVNAHQDASSQVQIEAPKTFMQTALSATRKHPRVTVGVAALVVAVIVALVVTVVLLTGGEEVVIPKIDPEPVKPGRDDKTDTDTIEDDQSEGLSTGAIIGWAVGGLVLLLGGIMITVVVKTKCVAPASAGPQRVVGNATDPSPNTQFRDQKVDDALVQGGNLKDSKSTDETVVNEEGIDSENGSSVTVDKNSDVQRDADLGVEPPCTPDHTQSHVPVKPNRNKSVLALGALAAKLGAGRTKGTDYQCSLIQKCLEKLDLTMQLDLLLTTLHSLEGDFGDDHHLKKSTIPVAGLMALAESLKVDWNDMVAKCGWSSKRILAAIAEAHHQRGPLTSSDQETSFSCSLAKGLMIVTLVKSREGDLDRAVLVDLNFVDALQKLLLDEARIPDDQFETIIAHIKDVTA